MTVTDTTKELKHNGTTIPVAHRRAPSKHIDVLVHVEPGLIVAQGTFGEVRPQSPALDRRASLLGAAWAISRLGAVAVARLQDQRLAA